MFRLLMLILSGVVAAVLVKGVVIPTVEHFNKATCAISSEVCS